MRACSSAHDGDGSVRERSRAIIELLNDPERLAEEREKAKHNRGKYTDSMGSEGASSPSFASRDPLPLRTGMTTMATDPRPIWPLQSAGVPPVPATKTAASPTTTLKFVFSFLLSFFFAFFAFFCYLKNRCVRSRRAMTTEEEGAHPRPMPSEVECTYLQLIAHILEQC